MINSEDRLSKGAKIFILLTVLVLFFIIYTYRLFSMQIVQGEHYRSQSQRISSQITVISAQRGEIFDRNALLPIVINTDSFAVEVTPGEIPKDRYDTVMLKLAQYLGISKAEATHCIFNDLRVTRDNRDVRTVIDLIIKNRETKANYDTRGDVIRYAGDILDYMVLANLLKTSHNYFYLNRLENEAIQSFINSIDYFEGYDAFYGTSFEASELNPIETDWFEYVNSGLDNNLFKTDISQYITESDETQSSEYRLLVKDKIGEVLASANTKEIGDLGETLVIGHEKVRVKEGGRSDLLHLIKKIPTSLAVGYDVQSIELDAKKRYIEVKTTISSKPLSFYSFHLTPNEWDTASSLDDRYFVYRLMISKNEITIFILQNPVQMYKDNRISLSLRDGAEITFSAANCVKSELKIWKE